LGLHRFSWERVGKNSFANYSASPTKTPAVLHQLPGSLSAMGDYANKNEIESFRKRA
jgi:hypothetical protein